ncbi:hypothetical protein NVP1106O_37 [Vibrio phage 1.106.O._10N.286.51.F7]|nr:hypothetical protein NVP1106O_37 [Vibrio phage 1.106.O._10N.286.51.F7]
MRKYTEAELLCMVDFVVDAKLNNNPLYSQFIMVMCLSCNVEPDVIERNIMKIKRTGKFEI